MVRHSESIISDLKQCYLCATTVNLHRHHIYFGNPGRKLSEKYGCWVWLCQAHHTGNNGVHHCKGLDVLLKRTCQVAAMRHYNWSVEDFRHVFGKNYI